MMSPSVRSFVTQARWTYSIEQVRGHGFTLEEVGCDNLETIASKVIYKKLRARWYSTKKQCAMAVTYEIVDELDTERIGEVDDDLGLVIIDRGRANVALHASDLLVGA